MAVILGMPGGDSLDGGADNDSLYGLAGDDTLFGGGLDDFLFGGLGNDTLVGGLGNDAFYLDSIGDILIDAGGIDLARIGAGASGIVLADAIERASAWGLGGRTITGGAGASTLTGGAGDDVLDGGDGADRLYGKAGFNSLIGGLLDDALYGGDGQDQLSAGEGNDILRGGTGSNLLDGGLGDDTYFLDSGSDEIVDDGGIDVVRVGAGASGIDLVDAIESASAWGAGARTFTGGSSANTLTGGADGDLLDGASGNDRLNGGAGADTLIGGADEDQLFGGLGNDRLEGGNGTDALYGSAGDDLLDGGAGNDRLDGGAGNDTVMGGSQDDRLEGGDGADTLQGDGGNDTLIGGAGVDTLDGGLGDDLYYLDSATDIAIDSGGHDTVRIGAGASGIVLSDDIEVASAWGAGARTITGSSNGNTLIGGDGDDLLTGGGGNDDLLGGKGNDTLVVSDTSIGGLDGGQGSDTLVLSGAGQTLDLSNAAQQAGKVDRIERIVLAGTGDNTLVIDDRAVRGMVRAEGGVHVLTVEGDAGDTVSFADVQWTSNGTTVVGGLTFDRYLDGSAEVRVEQGLTVAFPRVLDLSSLAPSRGFIVQGDTAYNHAGRAVASAGDVNGDGFADMILGARYGDDGGDDAGEAYVVFGKASGFGTLDGMGRSAIDLTSLAADDGFIIQGDAAGDRAGTSVSSAGDVNGDGFADLIVGALSGDDSANDAGEAYVVFGKASGLGTVDGTGRAVIDLTSLDPADGFILQGDAAYDYTGNAVSSAGDVNGDGFADVIVGARYGNGFNGEAFVVFGRASGFGTVDGTGRAVIDLANEASSFTAAQGFAIHADGGFDNTGYSVSSAGDINGDGFADLIVGARKGDDGGNDAGEAYVIFGRASGFGTVDGGGQAVIHLSDGASSFSPAAGFIIQGDEAADYNGISVSSAGDINGDGFADVIVGARNGDDGGGNAGEAYVVFGKASGFGTVDGTGRAVIDLTSLAPADGFVVQGDTAYDNAGLSVSSAGDFNGDGFTDLIVGAPGSDDGGNYAGEAYVLFGKASGFGTVDGTGRAVIDLSVAASSFTPAIGFVVRGDQAMDLAGWSVSSAGDVNGDGFADLMVGARGEGSGGEFAGAAYVLFGGAFGASNAPVTTTGTGTAEILIGDIADDTLSGGGGLDVLRGGAGDDTLAVADLAFRSVDGGGGTDTLVLGGAGQDFDFTTLADNKVAGIEAIDIAGTGDNTLTLGMFDVLNISDTASDLFTAAGSHNALVIFGNAGDTLNLVGYDPDGGGSFPEAAWQLVSSGVGLDGTPAGAFDLYDLIRDGSTLASVAVHGDIVVA